MTHVSTFVVADKRALYVSEDWRVGHSHAATYLQLAAQASEPAAPSRRLLGCRGREATEAAPAGARTAVLSGCTLTQTRQVRKRVAAQTKLSGARVGEESSKQAGWMQAHACSGARSAGRNCSGASCCRSPACRLRPRLRCHHTASCNAAQSLAQGRQDCPFKLLAVSDCGDTSRQVKQCTR